MANGIIIQKQIQSHLVFQANIDYILSNYYLVGYTSKDSTHSTIYVDNNKTYYIVNSHLNRIYSYIKLNCLGILIIEKEDIQ